MACASTEGSLLIDEIVDAVQAIAEINTHNILAVDCEGAQFGRDGELTVLTIATPSRIFCFNTLKLGNDLFDAGLRATLGDTKIEKLMFDCRRGSKILEHTYEVKLTGILDLQLLEVMFRMDQAPKAAVANTSKPARRSAREDEVQCVKDYVTCLTTYTSTKDERGLLKSILRRRSYESTFMCDISSVALTNEGRQLLDSLLMDYWADGGRRVLDILLNDCRAKCTCLFTLFKKFRGNEENLERLRIASERYANIFQDLHVKTDDEYVNHAYLPLDVIPEKGTLSFAYASTECVTCHRYFAREEFSKAQLRYKVQKCRVCKKIKLQIDREKERARRTKR